jgi:hypothetical protein
VPFPIGFGNYPALAVDGEGRIYAGGQGVAFGTNPGVNLVRFLPNGNVDTTFPTDLIEVPAHGMAGRGIHHIVPLDGGRVFVAGNLRKFRGELFDAGSLTLTSEGNLDRGADWEDPMRLLAAPGFAFPGGDGGLFVARIEDSWTRLSLGKVWLKAEEARAQPAIVLSNSPPDVREPPSPSLSSVEESETGDVLLAGSFTHAAVEGREHRALGLALVRGGKLDVEFLDRVGGKPSGGREVLDARILSSGEIVFVGRSPSGDGRGESLTISRLSTSGEILRACQATFSGLR